MHFWWSNYQNALNAQNSRNDLDSNLNPNIIHMILFYVTSYLLHNFNFLDFSCLLKFFWSILNFEYYIKVNLNTCATCDVYNCYYLLGNTKWYLTETIHVISFCIYLSKWLNENSCNDRTYDTKSCLSTHTGLDQNIVRIIMKWSKGKYEICNVRVPRFLSQIRS